MDVVDEEEQSVVHGEPSQCVQKREGEHTFLGSCIVRFRERERGLKRTSLWSRQPGQHIGDDPSDQISQPDVRKSGLGLRRPSPEHQIAARLRHLDRSQRQRRLADPSLTDQHSSRERPIRRSKQIDESWELVLPANDGPNINCQTHVLQRVYDPPLQTWSQASAAPPSTLRNARADAR